MKECLPTNRQKEKLAQTPNLFLLEKKLGK
ncbi:hypothetical protein PARA125_001000 [Parachlamydia sp. AcF125]|nr:hypothetical protein [Parachlamydia sp. AcF125]